MQKVKVKQELQIARLNAAPKHLEFICKYLLVGGSGGKGKFPGIKDLFVKSLAEN